MPACDSDNASDAASRALQLAGELGFALAGVCGVEPSRFGDELRSWLDAGKHGSMAYLENHFDLRVDPGGLLEGGRSVLMVADLYASRASPEDAPLEAGRGRIARYARGRDYHKVIKKRLHRLSDALAAQFPGHSFKSFVDTAPVLERELAARAGLGWTGKHTLMIHPRLGSYMLLGGVMTTLELEPPADQQASPDHCGSCTACIDACPTDAITPYSVDGSRCISYLTIERRLPIDERFHAAIGGWVFGCDICQEVCPHNSAKPDAAMPGVQSSYEPRRDSFDLLEVLGWSEDDRRAAFETSSLKRATLVMMKRNAVIAAGNALREADLPRLRARLSEVAADPGEADMVRGAARAVLGSIERA